MRKQDDPALTQDDFEDYAQRLAKLIARNPRKFEEWDDYNGGSWSEELYLDDVNLADYCEVFEQLTYISPDGDWYERCCVLMNAYNEFRKWIYG